ncbi:MAG: hypothetical protein V2I33_16500, partial [Kangiellaceae bacterium]|nr:hypothetical protein [Kangiellaceae bacterium]
MCKPGTECPNGQYRDGLTCKDCEGLCNTCLTDVACLSCKSKPDGSGGTVPTYLHNNKCEDACPTGTYADATLKCQACDGNCGGCIGDPK